MNTTNEIGSVAMAIVSTDVATAIVHHQAKQHITRNATEINQEEEEEEEHQDSYDFGGSYDDDDDNNDNEEEEEEEQDEVDIKKNSKHPEQQ